MLESVVFLNILPLNRLPNSFIHGELMPKMLSQIFYNLAFRVMEPI